VKRIFVVGVVCLLVTGASFAQSASDRAWQQRLQVEIPLPVPMVELAPVNPFAIEIDEPASVLQSTPPRKVDVRGVARIAAYVDSKGECLGAVPLELPFPGMTSSVSQSLTGSRFDPAMAGSAPQASWVVLDIMMEGRVKEAEIIDQVLEPPNAKTPPVPEEPAAMAPPGNLRSLKATPQAQLSRLATPRRLKVSAPGRDDEVQIRALVHIDENGRCDRYVPLELYDGLNPWFSAYLATWKATPGTRNGNPTATWAIYSARIRMRISGLDDSNARVVRDQEYSPNPQ
jgi:hypothetical protein